jgi:hypothetical protein
LTDPIVDLPADSTRTTGFSKRIPLFLIAAGLLLVLFWLVLAGIKATNAGLSLLDSQAQAQAMMDDGIMTTEPEAAETLILDVRKDVIDLDEALGPLLPIGKLFGWIPKIGPVLAAGPELMTIANSGSEAAVHLVNGLKPALILIQQEGTTGASKIPALIEIVDIAEPDLHLASQSIDQVMEARADIENVEGMPWRVRTLIQQLDAELPALQDAIILAQVLPEMMGTQGEITYLLMAQNEDELRPTGGFLSGAGLVVVNDGNIGSVTFSDANLVDDWQNKPYELPPDPFVEFMGMDIFLFRDVNFWPNFPTSAEEAALSYSYGQDIPVGGVIAIDQQFVGMLLDALGPVYVPELERTVNSANVVSEMREAWAPKPGQENWISQRKAFMGPLSNAIRQKLEGDLVGINPVGLVRALHAAAEQRHLQIYIPDDSIEAALADAGWDGKQSVASGRDYLQVIDTSMGFNKVNAAIDRAITYQITLANDGSAQADLNLEYTHTAPLSTKQCDHGTPYTLDIEYGDLIDDCYWNYLRVYTPAGSELIEASQHPVGAEKLLVSDDWLGIARSFVEASGNVTVFDNFFVLPQGEQISSNFTYFLPSGIVATEGKDKTYRLTVDKQAGTTSVPFHITIRLPAGTQFLQASPAPTEVNGQEISFITNLQTDLLFDITYR